MTITENFMAFFKCDIRVCVCITQSITSGRVREGCMKQSVLAIETNHIPHVVIIIGARSAWKIMRIRCNIGF